MFQPAANANGTGYASFTFQVRDNGGTGNGGVDLDPTANTITFNVIGGERCAGRCECQRRPREDTAYVFAAADFGFSDTTATPCGGEDQLAAGGGTLKYNGIAITATQVSAGFEVSAADLRPAS